MEFLASLKNIEWGLKGLEGVINAHPLFVHFPIGLLLGAVAFYLLGSVMKKEEFFIAGKWTLCLGALLAAFTVWQGLEAEKTVPHGSGVHDMMIVHKYIGFAVLAFAIALSGWTFVSKSNIPQKGRPFFLIGLVVMAALLIQGGDLGGRMVFLHGTGVGDKAEVAVSGEHDHAKEHGGQEHGGQEHGGDDHAH